jgi:hypothetical protein
MNAACFAGSSLREIAVCRRRVNSLQIGRLKIDHFDAL